VVKTHNRDRMSQTIRREILFLIGVVTWIAFTVSASIDAAIGKTTPALDTLVYFLTSFLFLSLPVATLDRIRVKVVRWIRTQQKFKLEG
jgi:hypothetical protein